MSSEHILQSTGYLRIKQVLKIIPVSKSTWWAGVKTGRFPSPTKIGPRITVWSVEDINEFLARPDLTV